jgi:hypothetical protein
MTPGDFKGCFFTSQNLNGPSQKFYCPFQDRPTNEPWAPAIRPSASCGPNGAADEISKSRARGVARNFIPDQTRALLGNFVVANNIFEELFGLSNF